MKTFFGFPRTMKISRFSLFFLGFAASTVLNASVQCERLPDIQTWAEFQSVNLVSIQAVSEDCKQIFQTCRDDNQKAIDDLKQIVQNTDSTGAPPQIWTGLTHLSDIVKDCSQKVRFHFTEIGEHFFKRLDGAISIANFKKFDKIRDLQNIYDSEIDTTNEWVLSLEKSFGNSYNPISNFQQTVAESLNQDSYSQSVAEGELEQLSNAANEELNNLEQSAILLLNEMYKGITVAKDILSSLKATGGYPTKWDEQYIKDILQNSSFLAKALKIQNDTDADTKHPSSDTDIVESNTDLYQPIAEDDDDESGCGEIFRKTEKKIMKQLVLALKEIKSIKNVKEIDSRIYTIFKNYSLLLSNMNNKIITNVITVINQFFQLYHIVLSILDKINPDMKAKATELLYLTEVDTTEAYYMQITTYIVEDYLASSKMNEFYQKIDNHLKSMKSLEEMRKIITQELSVTTNELGQNLQTMRDTIYHIFEETKKGVTALQNIKNKSNRTGLRYYFNFYRGKSDLGQLKKLIHIINSLNIELLLERQMFNNEEELQDLELATNTARQEIDRENRKLFDQLNATNDFTYIRGFVSKSTLEYNMLLQSYCVQSRKTVKKVVTKYVTIFEEIIIIIKRKKIKNIETIENSFSDIETTTNDEIITKYLQEQTEVNLEDLCSSLKIERVENKETATEEIRELNTITRSEVAKINEKVKQIVTTLSTEIQNLKSIKEQASSTVDYEITANQLKCISNIVQLMNSLQIKSNRDEIQNLSIYFERIKEKIQLSIQSFETQMTECNDMQQFKTEIQNLKTSIYESLTQASFEINEKIRRAIFEYYEKLYELHQNTAYNELKTFENQSSFTLNDNTRKYITGCYTSAEIFHNLDELVKTETNTDLEQLKTDVSTQFDETIQQIESELNSIHDDLNDFVHKFSQAVQIIREIENRSQQNEQTESVDESKWNELREVTEMVKAISKYVNINAENAEKELKVQIDNARLQISQLCEQTSQTIATLNDETEIETLIRESIEKCESIYIDLKNSTRIELNHNTEEFLTTYQNIIENQSTDTRTTFLQDLHNSNYEADEKQYQKFVRLMHQQDYQSTTTVAESFSYLKKYNSITSQNNKEIYTRVFQSLSNKINLEIDSISYVSKYMLESLQDANRVLLLLENNEQSASLLQNKTKLQNLHVVKSIAESWKYSSQDNTMSKISSTINCARNDINIEYNELKTKFQSSSTQTDTDTNIQNIERIIKNAQTNINENIQLTVTNFYSSLSENITEFQSSGSEILYNTLQSILNEKTVKEVNTFNNQSQTINYDSFTSAGNIREIYNGMASEQSDSSKNIVELKQTIDQQIESIEKSSIQIMESIEKGYTVIKEIQTALQIDSNYQLTQQQQEQLRKFVAVHRKVENLNINTKTAQKKITNSIEFVRNQISGEHTKINDLVSSLTNERAIDESVTLGVNKFEQIYSQAKQTVKEQLSLTSSKFYNSYSNLLASLEKINSDNISTTMRDIKTGSGSYQIENDQSFMDHSSYFNSNCFKSYVSINKWFSDIHSSTCTENYYSYNDRCTSELASLNEQINSSLEKMEISSTYVLETIEKSTEILTQIEISMKQTTINQLTEEQIVELQKCMSIYKIIQIVSSSTSQISSARETIESNISDIKSQINSAYTEITESLTSKDEHSVEEIILQGVKRFEQLYSNAKTTIKEEISQTLTNFYSSFAQISTDLHEQNINTEIDTVLQEIKNNIYQSENDQNLQETTSYFTDESFKSCVAVKHWFEQARSSTSTYSNVNEKSIAEFNSVNELMNSYFEKIETSSIYIFESILKSTQIIKQIENSVTQNTTYQLSQEQITELRKSVTICETIKSVVSISSTSLAQQIIQNDITNVKEEISSTHCRLTETISSLSDDIVITEIATKGVDKFERIYSHATEIVKEELFQVSSSFYTSLTQVMSDLQYQQNDIRSITETQSENDQTFDNTLSYFNSEAFTSEIVYNWYQEIHFSTSTTEWSYTSERIVSEFDTLNERIVQSFELIQENSKSVLNTIKTGTEILHQMQQSAVQGTKCELTQEQASYLKQCTTIYQNIELVRNSSTSVSETKRTITKDINDLKNQLNQEFSNVSQSINSLSDENQIRQTATESVNRVREFYGKTKEEVQCQLKQTASNFYSTFEKITAEFDKNGNTQMSSISQEISDKTTHQTETDQSYSNVISYLKSDSFSNTAVQNWYQEIQSTNAESETTSYNERAINELNLLNERITKSADSMKENSTHILSIIETGQHILKQFQRSSSYQLNQEEITSLQKCISIYHAVESITTTNETNTSHVKQTINQDIRNVKNQINNEFDQLTRSISTLTDNDQINNIAIEGVNKVDIAYTQTKEKIQSQLNESSSTFYEKITNLAQNHQESETLHSIISSNNYQSQNDQSFQDVISYFSGDSYKSTNQIQNWYSEISNKATTSETTIKNLNTLQERITKSIDTMETSSTYVVDIMESGHEILKQLDQSSITINKEQVTQLQKCMKIYKTISTTNCESENFSEIKQTITTDISNTKTQINDELTKAKYTLSSATDEATIQQTINENINKVSDYYAEAESKVQTQLMQTSSNFFRSIQELSESTKTNNNELNTVLQDITSNRNAHQSESNESFINTVSFLSKDLCKSKEVVKNWYTEIHSSSNTNEFTNSENAITELSNLNERVITSIDTMQTNSNSVLDIIEKGSEVIKQVKESTRQESTFHLSEDQIIELQNCVTIYQIIQTTTTTNTSSVTNIKETVNADINNTKTLITEEFEKTKQSIKSLSDETSVQQAVEENVKKVEQYYGDTKQKIHTDLEKVSSEFFNNYQQIITSNTMLRDIDTNTNNYQSDEETSKVVSYLRSDSFKSNNAVHNFQQEIQSSSTSDKITSDIAIANLDTLSERVTKSIETMNESSTYVFDSMERGLTVLTQVQESFKADSNYQLTEEEITELKKCVFIYQSIQYTDTSEINEINTVKDIERISQTEQTIATEMQSVKSQMNSEYEKSAQFIRSQSDKESIKQAVDNNVKSVDNYYKEAKQNVQNQLTQTSSDFFNSYQSISKTVEQQGQTELNNIFQKIISSENNEVQSDETFSNTISYFNSETFHSNTEVENMYSNLQSSTSIAESTESVEQEITKLSTLNNQAIDSVNKMEENSKYVLNTIKNGLEVLKQVDESIKRGSNHQLTEDQIINLQKCITIQQTIQCTKSNSETSILSDNETIQAGHSDVETMNMETDNNSNINWNSERSITEGSNCSSNGDSHVNDTVKLEESSTNNTSDVNNQENDIVTEAADSVKNETSTTNENYENETETFSESTVYEAEQKITSEASNVKTEIDHEYNTTLQTINSSSDETEIKKAIDENVQKVDHYYCKAKQNMESQLTQTTTDFFTNYQKISENSQLKQNEVNSILQDIQNNAARKSVHDENFEEVIIYLNNNSFNSKPEIQSWYQEIQTNTADSSSFKERSINELSSLNNRVKESVNTMENRSKYVMETMKKGTEILKQLQESTKQHSDRQLTEEEIIELEKCITIYQIIQSVSVTTNTSSNNTTEVFHDSVTNQSTYLDEEYEYVVEVTKNTRQVVQVEETEQEENQISVIESQQISEHDMENKPENNFTSSTSTSQSVAMNENVEDYASFISSDTSQLQQNDYESDVTFQDIPFDNINPDEKDILSEFNVSSNKTNSSSVKNRNSSMKRTSHSSKIDLLKKYSQDQTTYSKTSLNTLMIDWNTTKSAIAGSPNTCESLDWDDYKYFSHEEDQILIKEIADLLAVGRSVTEEIIELKKEKLPLYRGPGDVDLLIASTIEAIDETLIKLSEVIGEDVSELKIRMYDTLNHCHRISLDNKVSSLDEQFLATVDTFFSMKNHKRTDLLSQINKKLDTNNHETADDKFDELHNILEIVLGNIDCLVLRVVDTIMNAKNSLDDIQFTNENCIPENSYVDIKNGQTVCELLQQ